MYDLCQFRPYSDTCDYEQLDSPADTPIRAIRTETTDAPGSTASTYSMNVGDSFGGTIGFGGDQDWVRISLTAGQSYDIDLRGAPSGAGTLSDPYLRLYDSSGVLIAQNDDSGTLESHLTYAPATGGTYFVSAGAYSTNTGSYSMTVTENVPSPTGSLSELSDFLTDGYWTGAGQRAHHFADGNLSVNITGLTANGQRLARWAMETWEAVADINFTETSSFSADITFDDNAAGAFATATWDGFGNTTSADVNISTAWIAASGSNMGSYGFQTYIHELGHALGLGHQGGYNGAASYGVDDTFANDSWQMSVMSYFSQTDNTTIDASLAEVVSAMTVDIVAIQSLYGAAGTGSLTAGNTTYGVGHTLGNSWLGQLFDQMYSATPNSAIYDGGPVAATIYDAGGRDIIDFSNDTTAQLVNLTGTGISNVYGETGNLVISPGTAIEEFRAGSGNDTVNGGNANNTLVGNAGNDILRGGLGNDRLSGGAGDDMLNGGSLTLSRSDGADAFIGGAGIDTVTYEGSAGSLLVDMVYTQVNTFSATGDTFDGIENLTGSQGADNLRGTNEDNVIRGTANVDYIFGRRGDDTLDGGVGDDVLFGGLGADTLIGGVNRDRAQYSQSQTELLLDLMDATRNTGEGIGDTYSSIEDLAGSEFNDEVYGNNAANRLFGRGGDDRLTGRWGDDYLNGGGGQDTLLGGIGNDTLRGGASIDTFVFDSGHDVIEDYFLDMLRLDDGLWGNTSQTRAQILSYASVVGTDTVFDFGSGNTLTLENYTDISALENYISVF